MDKSIIGKLMTKLWGGLIKNGRGPHKKRSVLMYGLIVLVMVMTSFAVVQAEHNGPGDSSATGGSWDGDGSQIYPYQIDDIADLQSLADQVNNVPRNDFAGVHFILTHDLDLTEYLAPGGAGYNSGAGWVPIGTGGVFYGSFDGDGHTITGLFVNTTSSDAGLFGTFVGNSIKNLGLVNVSITGSGDAGGLAGFSNGDIENCFVTGNVKGTGNVGGLVGNGSSFFSNCYNASNVVGGIAGGIAGGNSTIGGPSAGNCFNSGDIKGTSTTGGIIGDTNRTVQNCYSTGSVFGGTDTGGIVGSIRYAVTNCFFLSESGGINDGLNGAGVISDTSGPSIIKADPKTMAELQTMSTFTTVSVADGGWDFSDSGPWGMFLKNDNTGESYGCPYIKTIENFILITPDGGSKVYDGTPAPEPPGWEPAPSENVNDLHPISVLLSYDPSPAVGISTYGISLVSMDSPYYQLRFKDDVQFTITAPTGPKSYTITPSSDTNSTISPSKQVTVQSGGSYTFTYSAASGYHISSVLVNGKELTQTQIDTGSYTFTDVNYNQTIDVYSASGPGSTGKGTYITLTEVIVGGKGTAEYHIGSGQYISFTGSQSIPAGSDLYVSVVADSGYSFVQWTGDVNTTDKELNFTDVDHDINLTAHLSNDNATGSAGKSGNFAFANLILAILALLIGIIAILAGIWSRKDDENKSSGTAVIAGIIALIVGIVSIIVFFLTEDLSAPMISTDNWTIWMAVLFVVTVIFAAITFWASRGQKAKGKT